MVEIKKLQIDRNSQISKDNSNYKTKLVDKKENLDNKITKLEINKNNISKDSKEFNESSNANNNYNNNNKINLDNRVLKKLNYINKDDNSKLENNSNLNKTNTIKTTNIDVITDNNIPNQNKDDSSNLKSDIKQNLNKEVVTDFKDDLNIKNKKSKKHKKNKNHNKNKANRINKEVKEIKESKEDLDINNNVKEKTLEKITFNEREDFDELLDELSKKTNNISEDEEPFIEQISFLDSKPKISKIKLKNLNVENLYSKIDSLVDKLSKKEAEENLKHENSLIEKNLEIKDNQNNNNNNNNKVNENKEIKAKTFNSKDVVKSKANNTKSNIQHINAVVEEFDIPKIISIDDDVKDTSTFATDESFSSREMDSISDHNQKPGFVHDEKGVKINPDIKEDLSKLDKSKKEKKKKDKEEKEKININLNLNDILPKSNIGKDSSKLNKNLIENKYSNYDKPNNNNNNSSNYNLDSNNIESSDNSLEENNSSNDNDNNKFSNQKDSFILPKDSRSYVSDNKIKSQLVSSGVSSKMMSSNNFAINSNNGEKFSNLVYSIPIISNYNINNIDENYSIDEFTFVTINKKNNHLLYNIVQPELDEKQKEIFKEIKRLFLDSIDQNYYSFRGDKQSIKRYIQKVYDLTINKLSYNINSLDKKLYFSFIEKDFSGLGFLSAILHDRNIIEVSCIGVNSPIIVYHVKYGAIETNLSFDSIAKLNIFVLSLTKLIGLQINSNNPVINGYLPNGYKVEGLYSVGDISSKGSSFVIKKYLEEPLTPVSLINLGIGACDIFAYIWSAINDGYNIIIKGTSDKTLVLNSLALLFPESQIISIQKQDNLKLPQKNWIRRIVYDNSTVNTKTILTQSISEKPDYLIVDGFTSDLFDCQWYSINLLSTDNKIANEYIEKTKLIGQKSISIELNRMKFESKDYIQFNNITEYNRNEENIILNLESNKEFKFNLLASDIDVVDFKERKEIIRWMLDSKIINYKDFNSVISDYKNNKEKLLNKLGIIKE